MVADATPARISHPLIGPDANARYWLPQKAQRRVLAGTAYCPLFGRFVPTGIATVPTNPPFEMIWKITATGVVIPPGMPFHCTVRGLSVE